MSHELYTEQTKAMRTLVSRGDLLVVLQNDFGKSLIFQALVHVEEILTGKTSVVIVVCLFLKKSIVQDQIAEASLMGLIAVSLADNRLEDIENAEYQLFFFFFWRRFFPSPFFRF